MRLGRTFLIVACTVIALHSQRANAQAADNPLIPPAPHGKQIHLKHVLVISQTKGFQHDSIPAAMAAIYNMGQESGLWDTEMRTHPCETGLPRRWALP